MHTTQIHPLQTWFFGILTWWSPWALVILLPCAYRLSTNEPKHWRSLCNTCDNSCVCTTQHVILLTRLRCFWRLELTSKGTQCTNRTLCDLQNCTPCPMKQQLHWLQLWFIVWLQILSETCDQQHHQCGRHLYIYGCLSSLLKQTPTK